MPRRQCKKCPWRADVDPRDIPNGLRTNAREILDRTLASPGELRHGRSAKRVLEAPPRSA